MSCVVTVSIVGPEGDTLLRDFHDTTALPIAPQNEPEGVYEITFSSSTVDHDSGRRIVAEQLAKIRKDWGEHVRIH